MKKQLLLALALLTGVISIKSQITTSGVYTHIDTVKYVDSKTSVYSGIPLGIDQLNGASDDGYVQYAQMFEAPDTVTIKGGCFYAVMDFDPSDTVYLMLYDTLVTGGPGATIDSVELMALTLGTGYTGAMNNPTIKLCGDFATPIRRKGSYFMGMQNQDTSDIFIARNADGDGAGEGLHWMYYKLLSNPLYDGWYSAITFGAGWNIDFVVEPLVSYEVEMSITLDTALCLGDTLVTTTTAALLEDGALSSRFYNPNFASYSGLSYVDSADFGDGMGLTDDTTYEYLSGGVYNFTSSVYSNSGWTMVDAVSNLNDMIAVTDASVDLGLDLSGCSTDSVVLNAGSNFDSYVWSDASVDTMLIVQLSGLPAGNTDYFVDVTLNGCTDRDSIVVTVGSPEINLGNDTTLCLNQSIDLDAGVFDSYNWNTGQTTQIITVGPSSTPGVNTITVDVVDGSCAGSDTIVVTIDNCLSVEELENAVNVFPNPVQNELNVMIEGLEFANCSYTMIDASGKLIVSNTAVDSYNKIDVSNFESGLYFMTVTNGNTSIVKQISIIK